jgi:hydrogenase maturation protein HypF
MHALLAEPAVAPPLQRRRVRVRGAVQGVGFRPFCARLANEHGLTGWVRNDGAGVEIEVQGAAAALDAFAQRLAPEAPPLARVERIESAACTTLPHERAFAIAASSTAQATATIVPPDACTCEACLDELFDPSNRRHRYPFINCTHCGPRWTITERLPYDRPFTSMAHFALCAACASEYGDPSDRRYHAQPNACAICGPQLRLLDAGGRDTICTDVIAAAAARLRAGDVLAIKGVGGFHLVCDAQRADTLARLRNAKVRASKPFAVMCLNTASVARWADLDARSERLLTSVARPIVLLPKKPDADRVLRGVAPGTGELGAMLPYAPLHWLLFHELLGRPAGSAWRAAPSDIVLLMTSANPGGEPLVIGNDEALERLRGLADGYVVHNRPIVARCDDSVVRADAHRAPQFVRRARGYVPLSIPLPGLAPDAPAVLACGAWLKNAVCVTRGNEAFLSPHIGDLQSAASCAALAEAVERLTSFLGVAPRLVLHDLHPDFFSTRFAAGYARACGIEARGVQHHHAHIAAVCAEHGMHGPVLGVALDGVGLGTDGAAWGGELLRVEGSTFERIAHFAPLALPGGDAAARAPWRVAASVLHALGRGAEITRRFAAHAAAPTVAQMLLRDLNCPRTTSAGRVFDAAAALLGLAELNRHEAEAALALEAAAFEHGAAGADVDACQAVEIPPRSPFIATSLQRAPSQQPADLRDQKGARPPFSTTCYRVGGDGTLDLMPLLERLADIGADVPLDVRRRAAAVFHATLAHALAHWATGAARRLRLDTIALAGGCWLNRRLRHAVVEQLEADGFAVLEARAAPPNDGGIALGQAWVGLKGI